MWLILKLANDSWVWPPPPPSCFCNMLYCVHPRGGWVCPPPPSILNPNWYRFVGFLVRPNVSLLMYLCKTLGLGLMVLAGIGHFPFIGHFHDMYFKRKKGVRPLPKDLMNIDDTIAHMRGVQNTNFISLIGGL